ncbi:hypothetical protein [Nocardia cyriacigeorgica]|uniref:hypothetical protein n=1 Tax=Nocardia cyriacigeorgica TaxID=135487 RepID=UPI001893D8C8|nr:hypothetical protein [Nocardia cyriacigeorgica]MBF6285295.1 hypothetical protein [Nocardia cyriacigeorgica]
MSVVDLGGVDPNQWRQLLDQANSGELTLDKNVGTGLDLVCRNYLDKLDLIFNKIQHESA